MAEDTQQNQRERQLFATLIASKPARARSPVALGLSVAVHIVLLGLLIYASNKYVPRFARQFFEDVTVIVPEEPQVAVIKPQAQAAPPAGVPARKPRRIRPAQPAAAAEQPITFTPGPIQPITPPTAGAETVEPSGEGGVRGGSLVDQLKPGRVDPRLTPGATYTLPPSATPADIVRLRIAETLRAYNDSIASEDAAHRRALDWTIKTKDGKQWGIGADGKLHLGDITIPIPVAFSPPPGRRDEINARLNAWAEIEAQANREIGRQTVNDRIKAIRARKDKEREEKKKAEQAPITY